MGPLIGANQCEFIRGQIDDAVAKGARLLTGGEYQGNLFQPAVVTDVTPPMAQS